MSKKYLTSYVNATLHILSNLKKGCLNYVILLIHALKIKEHFSLSLSLNRMTRFLLFCTKKKVSKKVTKANTKYLEQYGKNHSFLPTTKKPSQSIFLFV